MDARIISLTHSLNVFENFSNVRNFSSAYPHYCVGITIQVMFLISLQTTKIIDAIVKISTMVRFLELSFFLSIHN
jgi:hypothetical protein